MDLKKKYQKVLENELLSFNKKDDIDLYVKTINETCAKIQSFSEAAYLNSVDTGLAGYGYWILPDGSDIPVEGFQQHKLAAIDHGFKKDYEALDAGWIRLITDTEFVADFETINEKQFRTLMEILKDHNSFEGYTRFTLGTDDGGRVFDDMSQFVNVIRGLVNKPKEAAVTTGTDDLEKLSETTRNEIYWFDASENKLYDIHENTHHIFVKDNPEMFGYNPESSENAIDQALKNNWVRAGIYGDIIYLMANEKLPARKALTAMTKQYPEVMHVEIELPNEYHSLDIDKALKFLSGRLNISAMSETEFKENRKTNINRLIAEQTKPKANLYKNLTEQNKMINEGISNASALRTRSDLMKLARRYTDSGNVFAPSNFESYEDQDHMVLKVSVFDNDSIKLHEIKNHITGELSRQGWNSKDDIYFKESIRVKFFEIKKCFRSGAYQNRETPHLGIAIKGPKKSLI